MTMYWDQMPWFWGVGMLIGVGAFILFWVLVLAGLVLLARWLWVQARPTSKADESALEILKRRYARGEITREEFETIRRDLLA
jgi:putative membrane protein